MHNSLIRSYDGLQANLRCYTSQLKRLFWLDKNVSRAMGQNSLLPRANKTH